MCCAFVVRNAASIVLAETAFVAVDPKKPSLAVLSLGCGTTSELKHVDPDAGAIAWAVGGDMTNLSCNSRMFRHSACQERVMLISAEKGHTTSWLAYLRGSETRDQ